MSIADLCAATITLSDNTAEKLLLATRGGPEGFTAFLRALGEKTSRLDPWEPELNEGLPNDPRDTTTPDAMADTLEALLFANVLSPPSRVRLEEWMNRPMAGALRPIRIARAKPSPLRSGADTSHPQGIWNDGRRSPPALLDSRGERRHQIGRHGPYPRPNRPLAGSRHQSPRPSTDSLPRSARTSVRTAWSGR